MDENRDDGSRTSRRGRSRMRSRSRPDTAAAYTSVLPIDIRRRWNALDR
ncbi:hypothetical protein MBEHAL_2177 [Halarchaeum acidiphilum MH1-52-1]|uniref:Uncharacterized protein n=1 Tax=Halarchaeum acidiphilum MH1-52-1 TaxID=1261545 RepID=U2YXB2_9EURY|nr:hypothetical protein MBEHAL_2177 [Halarchaeum acidiphilum MH1-52-1]